MNPCTFLSCYATSSSSISLNRMPNRERKCCRYNMFLLMCGKSSYLAFITSTWLESWCLWWQSIEREAKTLKSHRKLKKKKFETTTGGSFRSTLTCMCVCFFLFCFFLIWIFTCLLENRATRWDGDEMEEKKKEHVWPEENSRESQKIMRATGFEPAHP